MRSNYTTDQRNIIERYLIDKKDEFINCQDILKYVQKNKAEIGLTTIYRFLNLLEKNGKVRVEVYEHTKYYQYIQDECSNHFHLKCKKCGKVIHLNCNTFKSLNDHITEKHKFKLDYNTMIYGICEDCSDIN